MEISSIINLLLKRIWIILIVPAVAVAAAFFFTLNLEKKYRSTAQLSTGFTTTNRITLTEERVSLYDAGIKFNNMIETMNSEQIMTMLSYRLILHDLMEEPFRQDIHLAMTQIPGLPSLDSTRRFFQAKLNKMEVVINSDPTNTPMVRLLERMGYVNWKIKQSINIKRVENTDYVSVACVTENPYLSSFAANALAEEFIRHDNSLKTAISNESVTFFSTLVMEKKAALDEKTAMLANFKATNGLFVSDNSAVKSDQITDYEMLRQQKQDRIRGLLLSIDNTNSLIAKIDNATTGDDSNAALNSKILDIRKRINDLNDIYIKGGASDNTLLATINELRDQLQIEMNKLAATQTATKSVGLTREELILKRNELELELEIERGNLNSINSTIATMRNSISGSVSKEATIEALEREIKTASDEYLQAQDKYNTERNKSLLSGTSAKLAVRAQPNGSPESTKTLMIIGLSGAGSFSICVFALILLEFADPRIKQPGRFQSLTNVNLLGSINMIPVKNLDLISLFKGKSNNAELEHYKHFLRKIRFEIENSGAKVIMVTSNKPGEGKSFTILSLAYSLSLLNKRILIVDTNFRNNSLTKSLIAKPKFSFMLTEMTDLKLLPSGNGSEGNPEKGERSIISQTSDKNIDIVGTSVGLQSPSEIFAGRDFMGMIQRLKTTYDYIFLEGPSLNEYSDTKELMFYVDGVIQVYAADSIIKQVDRESIKYLKSLKERFFGAVLNKVELKELI